MCGHVAFLFVCAPSRALSDMVEQLRTVVLPSSDRDMLLELSPTSGTSYVLMAEVKFSGNVAVRQITSAAVVNDASTAFLADGTRGCGLAGIER